MSRRVRRRAGASFTVIPTGAALGAEIMAGDLRLHRRGHLRPAFSRPGTPTRFCCSATRQLGDSDLIAFSRRFGDLDFAPIQENGRRFVEGMPEIYIVSNVKVNGEAIGSLGDGEAVWHTDMSYLDLPPKASMLYALEVPPAGGNTSFCSMYAVYEALPAALKARIARLSIKHDGTYNSGGYVRLGVTPTDDPRTSPGTMHPLVCTHPDTGRRMLYLGRRRNAYIGGLRFSRNPRRCSTNYGATWRGANSPGSTSGASATSCCGTTAAPCIGATPSTRRRAGSCTAPRSRAKRGRREPIAPAPVRGRALASARRTTRHDAEPP